MIAKYLWIVAALILLILGSIHLYYTFFTNKFSSKNTKLIKEMKASSLVLTNETTVWKAWIGFNASHSSGAMFMGIINIYLVFYDYTILENNYFLYLFNISTVGFYAWLAKKYWFKIPFFGISVTLLCYILSFCFMLL